MKKTQNFKKRGEYVIGVDEVGRGPLAGPVTVCAVICKSNIKNQAVKSGLKLKDSKKLTERQREKWFLWIKEQEKKGNIFYNISNIFPKTIDRINISQAANLASSRAIENVIKKSCVSDKNIRKVYLDGGLYPALKNKKIKWRTIIRGDEKISVISLASIVAKVSRDRYMVHVAKKYPRYGFDVHKGYGTKSHMRILKKIGCSPIHRSTFVRFLKK